MSLRRPLYLSVGFVAAAVIAVALLASHYRHELYQSGIESNASALGLQIKTLEVDGMLWSYMENERQAQQPTLVLVHGFGASKDTWLALSKYLAADYHLVIPDLPGHGDSGFDPSLTYSLATQSRLLHDFVTALDLEPFHLLGNSMGGGITGAYAGTYPDQLRSAILLNPAGIVEYRSDYQQRLEQGENPLLVNSVADLDFLFEYAVADKISIHWPFNQVLVDKAIARRPAQDKVFNDLTADPSASTKAQVAQITAPTLVVWGKQDRIIAPENAALYQQANPSIQVKLLDHVGHIPMVEIPEACAGIVREFTLQAAR
ncbi:alpha/beta fold hydrolase [Ketobacter sp.]|uniref:alpha/beta fold hydrolase n=1 Tax=Ketobacter sp. TaxID=2083498 RepID=UPI000F2C5CD4|nr:alpha/beta hydrolase [Ketobacter sp.]RLU02054.1 MAG: alpha/beta hydrolase [Ketobacter sp.]